MVKSLEEKLKAPTRALGSTAKKLDLRIIDKPTTLEKHIYAVNNEIVIVPGGSLEIAPGTEFYFTQDVGITCYVAPLSAEGTKSERIIFTSDKGWKGIALIDSTLSNISYCTLSNAHGKTHLSRKVQSIPPAELFTIKEKDVVMPLSTGGALCVLYGEPKITNCVFEKNDAVIGGGAFFYKSGAVVKNNTFEKNFAALLGGGIAIIDEDKSSPLILPLGKTGSWSEIIAPNLKSLREIDISRPVPLKIQKEGIILQNNKISNNESIEGGGAYLIANNVLITKNEINNNTALNGGGIYICIKTTGRIYENNIGHNFSHMGGAGVVFKSAPVQFFDNIIYKNHSNHPSGAGYAGILPDGFAPGTKNTIYENKPQDVHVNYVQSGIMLDINLGQLLQKLTQKKQHGVYQT